MTSLALSQEIGLRSLVWGLQVRQHAPEDYQRCIIDHALSIKKTLSKSLLVEIYFRTVGSGWIFSPTLEDGLEMDVHWSEVKCG